MLDLNLRDSKAADLDVAFRAVFNSEGLAVLGMPRNANSSSFNGTPPNATNLVHIRLTQTTVVHILLSSIQDFLIA